MKALFSLSLMLALTLTASAARYVLGTGDSIMQGYLSSVPSTKNPIAVLASQYQATTFVNDAPFDAWPTIASQTGATRTIAAVTAAKATGYSSYTVVIHAGGDDFLDGTIEASVESMMSAWIAALRAAHPDVKIVGCTVLYADVGTTVNAKRAAYNTWIRGWTVANGHANGFDYVADIDANPIFGTDWSNTTYYQASDHLHLTDTGYATWSAILRGVLVSNGLVDPNYYVTQSGAGSGTGLSLGNAASMASHNSHTTVPGDLVSLNGTLTTTLTVHNSGTAGNPITYQFASGAKFSKATWAVDTGAAIDADSKNYITIDGGTNGIIECTDNGDALGSSQGASGVYIKSCTNWEVKNLTIQNLYVHTYNATNEISAYSVQGVKGLDTGNSSVHNCTINGAYVAVYFTTDYAVSLASIDVYSNTISNCSTGVIVSLGADSGTFAGVNIYNNDITMGRNWYDPDNYNHIDGIHCWSRAVGTFTGLKIYGNYIHGDCGATHCTGFIFLESLITAPLVYNNLLVGSTTSPAAGYISISLENAQTFRVYNNTIVGIGAGTGVHFYGWSTVTASIKNNILNNLSHGVFLESGSATWDINYNDYYAVTNYGRIASSYYTTLSGWRTVTSGEVGGVSTNPALTGAYKLASNILPGTNLSTYFTTDREGDTRSAWNMGMDEYASGGGDTTAPTPNPATFASVTADSSSQITAVATTASDETALHATPYDFAIDGTWQGYQSSATKVFTSLTASTSYAFKTRTRDAAGNVTSESSVSNVSTQAAAGPLTITSATATNFILP